MIHSRIGPSVSVFDSFVISSRVLESSGMGHARASAGYW